MYLFSVHRSGLSVFLHHTKLVYMQVCKTSDVIIVSSQNIYFAVNNFPKYLFMIKECFDLFHMILFTLYENTLHAMEVYINGIFDQILSFQIKTLEICSLWLQWLKLIEAFYICISKLGHYRPYIEWGLDTCSPRHCLDEWKVSHEISTWWPS